MSSDVERALVTEVQELNQHIELLQKELKVLKAQRRHVVKVSHQEPIIIEDFGRSEITTFDVNANRKSLSISNKSALVRRPLLPVKRSQLEVNE